MCLIVFSFQNHRKYPLILAGNRDEFYARPAEQLHFWDREPRILAGKDLRAGGTWLGVSESGTFGAITNFRDFHNPMEGERSRGEIITELLGSEASLDSTLNQLNRFKQDYAGFNLLAGNARELYYLSNIKDDIEKVSPGIHGISNATLDTPWPKVETAIDLFRKAIDADSIDRDKIFEMLTHSDTYPADQLPDTGLSAEREKAVSPIFIETDGYGTRCSSLLTIDKNGRVEFTEKTHVPEMSPSESVKSYSFQISESLV